MRLYSQQEILKLAKSYATIIMVPIIQLKKILAKINAFVCQVNAMVIYQQINFKTQKVSLFFLNIISREKFYYRGVITLSIYLQIPTPHHTKKFPAYAKKEKKIFLYIYMYVYVSFVVCLLIMGEIERNIILLTFKKNIN